MEHEHNVSDNRLLGSVNLEKANNMVNSVEPTSNHCSPNESSNSDGVKSQELAANMPNEAFIYREDIVKCRKYEGLHGLVIKVAGDADSESSDSKYDGGIHGGNDSGGGGGNSYSYLPEGQVRLIWTDGSETVENISDVTVVDRCFFHDDVVSSSSNPAGQLGLVVDVSMTVDLLAADGEVIKHVSSKDLKRIREPLVGDYVVLGPWLGRVEDVVDNVTVLFDDGSVCKVLKADPSQLKPISKPVPDKAISSFYPGQRVRAVSSSVFRNSSWLSGLWKAKHCEGTVIEVQAESVVVYWIASAYHGTGTDSTAPSEEQEPKNLTLISFFSCANWKLGDWCYLLSHPLKYSSYVNEILENSKLLIKESRSHSKHSKESSLGEDKDVHTKSCMEDSDQALDDLDSVLGDHQAGEIPIPEAVVQGETIKASHVIMPGDYDLNAVSAQWRNGCYEKSPISKKTEEEFQSRHHDSTTIDEMNKAAKHETNSNNVFPECCLWSSTSSVSSVTTHENRSDYSISPRKREKKPCKTVERALLVVNTVTKVDVVWQDGTRENGLHSKYLIPISTLSDHEFFPEQYVMEKSSIEGDDSSEMKHVGVVRSVNSKERTVCVRWFKPLSRPEDSREFDRDEVVSAYELDKHPDYDFCYGDVVIRLSPVSVSADYVDHESSVKQHADLVEAEPNQIRKYSYCNEAEHVATGEFYENFTNISWVGNITSLQDGDIEVKWADGMVSKVGPQEVLVIDREDDGESDDGLSWETVDENEMVTLDNAEKEADNHSPIDNIAEWENQTAVLAKDNNAETVGPLSTRLFVLGMISRLCEILLSLVRKQLYLSLIKHPDVSETEYETVEVSARDTSCDEFNSKGYKLTEDLNTQKPHGTAERNSHVAVTEDEENVDASTSMDMNCYNTVADKRDDPGSFKHFDITENPMDHYFNSSPQNYGQRMWVKKIQQEWSILEKNLPDGIYVRVFEERMDLLRAVIVGPCGTPYQDGLFFFDFHLPREYPQVPPSAYYHSGGLRVNPNLYMDGKVCLSLLNTWTGSGNEVWDPSLSSILQVLVSLQGLVLNSKPYFNEPGYEKQIDTIEGEKNVSSYNENTYLLNLKSMLYLLRRPPMYFEGFVKDHFRKRGHYILKACEAYMNGSSIGSLTKDAGWTEKSREHPCSVGFKLMLAKIMPRLISTLSEIGVDCNQFEHLQRFESFCQS